MSTPAKIARPVRSAAQGTVSIAIVEFIDAVIYNMNDRAYGASIVLLAIVISWLQVLFENYIGKGLLRTPDE